MKKTKLLISLTTFILILSLGSCNQDVIDDPSKEDNIESSSQSNSNDEGGNSDFTEESDDKKTDVRTLLNYTISISFNGPEGNQTVIPEYADAYLIGDWDNFTDYVLLSEKEDKTYEAVISTISTGTHQFKGVMWYKGEEVILDNCVDIIVGNDGDYASFDIPFDAVDGGVVYLSYTLTAILEDKTSSSDETLEIAKTILKAASELSYLDWNAFHSEKLEGDNTQSMYLASDNEEKLYGYIESYDGYSEVNTTCYYVGGTEYKLVIDNNNQETRSISDLEHDYKNLFNGSYGDAITDINNIDLDEDNYQLSDKDGGYELVVTIIPEEQGSYLDPTSKYVYIVDEQFNIVALGSYKPANANGYEYNAYFSEKITIDDVQEKMKDFNAQDWYETGDDDEKMDTNGFTFALMTDEDAYYVASYDMTLRQSVVTIPSEYEGLPVISVGNPEGSGNSNAVFQGSSTDTNYLQAVIIPDSITTIATYAFYYCYGLKTITIPGSVETIGTYAFYNCYGLNSVVMEDGVKAIDQHAFHYCRGLRSVVIPSSVTTIGSQAFNACSALLSIDVPSSVESLGSNAFASCSGLLSASVSGSVGTLETSTFSSDYSLSSVKLGEGLQTIGSSAFSTCYTLETITLPSTLTSLDSSALACYDLRAVFIPQSVTTIAYNAFNYAYSLSIYYEGTEDEWNEIELTGSSNNYILNAKKYYSCSGINEQELEYTTNGFTYTLNEDEQSYSVTAYDKSITNNAVEILSEYEGLPVTAIGKETSTSSSGSLFAGTSNSNNYVQYVKIPESITVIHPYAFYNAYGLQEIEIPKNVESIGNYAFANCYALRKVTFSNDSVLNSIGTYAFSKCYAMSSINLPDGLETIGTRAFEYCSCLTFCTIPEGVTELGAYLFQYSYGMRYASIPSTVSTMGGYLFYNCYALEEVVLTDGLSLIGDSSMFSNCYNLTSIKISNKISTLGTSTFNNCYNLDKVIIPTSVVTISDSAFKNCYALSEVYYEGKEDEWSKIEMGETDNVFLLDASLYFYLDETPANEGNYWHYVNGVVTIW